MPATPASRLRHLVLLNAGLSLGSGMLLASAPATVGGWLGVEVDVWIRLIGIALAMHGLLLAWVLTKRDITVWVRINVAAIAPYPLVMIGLVLFDVIATSGGKVLALIDGAIVATLAIGQARLVGPRGAQAGSDI